MLDGLTILIVDEDKVFRTVYERYFHTAGAQVICVPDAKAALQSLSSHHVDAVVTEVVLPGKNGLRFVKDVRARGDQRQIPIIFLTVIEAADVGLYASLQESLGIGAYIVKQRTTPETVVKTVANLVEVSND